MKQAIPLILLAALASCRSAAQDSAAQALADVVNAATADGVVTSAESTAISSKMQAYVSAPGIDWPALAGTAVSTLAAAFLGIRYLPNRHIIGKDEAEALAKQLT
jgi:hypothetical protein